MRIRRARSVLKWPGGKYRLLPKILPLLPKSKCLVEPFVGSGVVFINSNYEHYLLNDINPDLINLYKVLQVYGLEFINYCKKFFDISTNKREVYYKLREKFNLSSDSVEKAALFLYLNRHGYNGLCRYTKKGIYNVPFGYSSNGNLPYFPKEELKLFWEKSKRAQFVCQDFREVLRILPKDCVIYADPPYVPLTETANFTRYAKEEFQNLEQQQLADMVFDLTKQGITSVVSNHATEFTYKLYSEANITEIESARFISCKGSSRKPIMELLAVFHGN